MINTGSRLYVFDFIRAAAVVFVLLGHYLCAFHNHAQVSSVWIKFHTLGVGMFFFISGYLIFLTLTKSRAHSFLIHRYFRLAPSLVLVLLFLSFMNHEFWFKNFILGSFFIGDFCGNRGVLGIDMWTLHTETRFYLIAYFIYSIFLQNKLKCKKRLAMAYLCSVGVVLSLLLLLNLKRDGFNFFDPKWNIYCILYLFFGIFLYLLHENIISKYDFLIISAANILLILLLRCAYFKFPFIDSIKDNYLLGCIFSLVLIAFKKYIPNIRLISLIAFISYPVYLIHHPMISRWGLLALIPIFIISYLISIFVEHPVMNLVKKYF